MIPASYTLQIRLACIAVVLFAIVALILGKSISQFHLRCCRNPFLLTYRT